MFNNRVEAGMALAKQLASYRNKEEVVVLSIPRGGVPVAAVVARELQAPLELVLSKKIGHPFHKEFAIGAVTLQDVVLGPQAADAPEEYKDKEIKRIRAILKQRYTDYYGNRSPMDLTNKIVILVDDGVATGNTLISSIELIKKQNPAEIVVALPVSPPSTLQVIKNLPEVNHCICLLAPLDFFAVGQFYEDFTQVPDAEVVALMAENAKYLSA